LDSYEDWLIKVAKIAYIKYEIDGDILEEYKDRLDMCFNNGFSPIRAVENIANDLFT